MYTVAITICKGFEAEKFRRFRIDDHSVMKLFLWNCISMTMYKIILCYSLQKDSLRNLSSKYSLTQLSMKLFRFKTFHIYSNYVQVSLLIYSNLMPEQIVYIFNFCLVYPISMNQGCLDNQKDHLLYSHVASYTYYIANIHS